MTLRSNSRETIYNLEGGAEKERRKQACNEPPRELKFSFSSQTNLVPTKILVTHCNEEDCERLNKAIQHKINN